MPKAYLTIDDGPSPVTGDLVDALDQRGIQALFFCRGDYMEEHFDAVVYAIQKGHVIGNHSYEHKRSSGLSFDEWTEDLEKTEVLIERAYKQAGSMRPGLYYRFPYLDRGDGELLERNCPEFNLAKYDKVQKMQNYLQERGFTQPFAELDHPVYKKIAGAADTLLTDTTQDWRLLARHLGRGKTTLDDLKAKMAEDPFIKQGIYEHVVLIHDDPEIHEAALDLVDYMREDLDFEFLAFLSGGADDRDRTGITSLEG